MECIWYALIKLSKYIIRLCHDLYENCQQNMVILQTKQIFQGNTCNIMNVYYF